MSTAGAMADAMFAQGVVAWSDGAFQLGAVWERFGHADVITHVFARCGDVMVDGAGATTTESEMLSRFYDTKRRGLHIGEFDRAAFDANGSIMEADWVSERLVVALGDLF